MLSDNDRKRTQQMHGLSSSSTGIPASRRDATNSTAQHPSAAKNWKGLPQEIPVPSNKPPPHRTPGANPFSNKRMDDTLTHVNKDSANHTSSRTVLSRGHGLDAISSRETKRRRLVGEGASERHAPSKYFTGTSDMRSRIRPSLNGVRPSSSTPVNVIAIDSEQEVGISLKGTLAGPSFSKSRSKSSSPDPIDALPQHDNDLHSATSRGKSPPSDMGPSSAQYSRLASDGHARNKLKGRLEQRGASASATFEATPQAITIDSDDAESIKSFSEPGPAPSTSGVATPHGTRLPANNVRSKKEVYESSARRRIPQIDLLAESNKAPQSKKKSMKPRFAKRALDMQQTHLDSVATSSTGYSVLRLKKSSVTKLKNAVAPEDAISLPLEAWALGCRLMQDDDTSAVEPKHWLEYSPRNPPSLSVSEHDNSGKKILVKYRIDTEIESSSVPRIPYTTSSTIVVQIRPKSKAMHFKLPGFEPGSKGLDGTVTFKFLVRHANWRDGTPFSSIVEALKHHAPNPEHHGARASEAIWQQTLNAVDMKQIQIRDSPPAGFPAKHEGSPLDAEKAKSRPTPRPDYQGTAAASKRENQATRNSARLSLIHSPTPDVDELILVYPPTGAGALSINTSDLKRLDEGNYLNDTLIEFGLKLWLADLREHNPELAEQVHVFSSFFYKKLKTKDPEEGYQSVRKWTSKFDLFKKKYIIVPINENFHWYLAIIYSPEHVLLPAPAPTAVVKPLTRKRKRDSEPSTLVVADHIEEVLPALSHRSGEEVMPDSTPSPGLSRHPESEAENEVEQLLDLGRSCSLNDLQSTSTSPDVTIIDVASESAHDASKNATRPDAVPMQLMYPDDNSQGETHQMDVDAIASFVSPEATQVMGESGSRKASDAGARRVEAEDDFKATIPPSRFYGTSFKGSLRKGKERVSSSSIPDAGDNGDTDAVLVSEVSEVHRCTYIFTFDSLGTKHPAAIKTLSNYLRMEAKDKRGFENTTPATGKMALVPTQPNYCDCGLYVLHFAHIFLSDPDHYFQVILSPKPRGYTAQQRENDWHNERVRGLREQLRARILALSEVWKHDRAAKEERRKRQDTDQSKEEDQDKSASTISTHALDGEIIIDD